MSHRFETLSVHAGVEPEPISGAVMTPIFQTSTYAQESPGVHKGYEYSRTDNPTRTALQSCLAQLESGAFSLVYSSGMAAIDSVLNNLKSGDHVVAGDDLYGGTYRLFTKVAQDRGLTFSFVSMDSEEGLRSALLPETKLIWLESPTNPLLKIIDLEMVAKVGREMGVVTAVDNTFMSPYFQRPLSLGIDIVMHSMTKYINGHSDVVMGSLMLNDAELYQKLKFLQNSIGGVPGPFDCWLALRGIKTLALRMQRHGQNALAVANWLEQHPKVERVVYPGLESHPQHEIAKRQMTGFGGMLTFFIKGNEAASRRVLSKVELFTLAESLGGVESLIEHPGIMTHASIPRDRRAELGITDNLIRASIGIEAVEDIIADLETALKEV